MSGSFFNIPSWSYHDNDKMYFASTGTYPNVQLGHIEYHGTPDYDRMWEQMYVHPKPVIIVCGFCNSHNVVSSPTCIQCGAPMGYGQERQYG